jgi:outer membrane receptor protein involved in Fe transport
MTARRGNGDGHTGAWRGERVTPWPWFCATWLAMVTVGSGALWPHRTLAQQANAPQMAETLEEIVISAQRRAEDVQKVPISMQVVTGQDLALQNQNSLDVMSQTVPGLHIAPDGPNSDMYIRGIGSGGFESVDQSVATFVDDIYHGRSRLSSTTFLDLDRVEVLKGPQTTYFGNNAIAGALNIVTKDQEADERVRSGWAGPLWQLRAIRVRWRTWDPGDGAVRGPSGAYRQWRQRLDN